MISQVNGMANFLSALPVLPTTLPAATAFPATVKAALPALTVMLVQGGLDLVAATVILIIGWTASRWLGRWLRDVLARSTHVDETLKPLLANVLRYAVLTITFVAVLGQFGVQTTSLIALIGATGLAVGLALQGTLSNVASGVMLLVLRPFRVGEKIGVGDASGTVREIGLFRTALVSDDGIYVSIPNTVIFSGTISNVSREPIRRTNFTIEVDRAAGIASVQAVVLAALAADPRVRKAPAATVEVETLGPISTTLSVQAWVENRDFGAIRAALRKAVRDALEAAGIAAPVPVPAPAVAPWAPPDAP
jgi:small conductance mechanosensitive channel